MKTQENKQVGIDSKNLPTSTQDEGLKTNDHTASNETHLDESNQNQPKPIQLSDKEAVELYVNDPENKANHLRIAEQLKVIFQDNWFTIELINKKTLLKDKRAATEMMLALQLFKLVVAQDGGMKYKHQTKFKLMICVEDRLKVLEQHKDNHLKQIQLIDKEIESVQQEIKNSEQVDK